MERNISIARVFLGFSHNFSATLAVILTDFVFRLILISLICRIIVTFIFTNCCFRQLDELDSDFHSDFTVFWGHKFCSYDSLDNKIDSLFSFILIVQPHHLNLVWLGWNLEVPPQ